MNFISADEKEREREREREKGKNREVKIEGWRSPQSVDP